MYQSEFAHYIIVLLNIKVYNQMSVEMAAIVLKLKLELRKCPVDIESSLDFRIGDSPLIILKSKHWDWDRAVLISAIELNCTIFNG